MSENRLDIIEDVRVVRGGGLLRHRIATIARTFAARGREATIIVAQARELGDPSLRWG